VAVAPVSSTAEKIDQMIYMVEKKDKTSLLLHLINEKKLSRALVFTRTKHGADKIAKDLNKANVQADALHGNKSQSQRERALLNFKNGRLKVLVATDIAARGIDVDNLSHVINFDLPNVPETYVHRIGRTGRAGAEGIALSFCDAEERAFLKDISKLIAQAIPVAEEHPYKMVRTVRSSSEGAPQKQFNRRPNNNGNWNKGYRGGARRTAHSQQQTTNN
jgi:ATP-dependent RNA helicase RhlE